MMSLVLSCTRSLLPNIEVSEEPVPAIGLTSSVAASTEALAREGEVVLRRLAPRRERDGEADGMSAATAAAFAAFAAAAALPAAAAVGRAASTKPTSASGETLAGAHPRSCLRRRRLQTPYESRS
jgi:hypothetical protein